MTQTIAIFIDAYRELNARRLFWITLALSGLIVVGLACLGINEDGVSVLVWTFPLGGIDSTVMPPDEFYKVLFTSVGVSLWLSIFATILALVSTASIVPDLISGGAIELTLSKPISRARLFLTKYLTGLMFATLQVLVFSVASFVLIGVRGNAWEPALFLAVPLVACFFSYLFAICALVGLLTRSTLTALLVTMLAWVAIFGLHTTEAMIYAGRIAADRKVTLIEKDIERREVDLARLEEAIALALRDDPRQGPGPRSFANNVEANRTALEDRRRETQEGRAGARKITRTHRVVLGVKTLLPKTTETIGVLERSLIEMAELPESDPAPGRADQPINVSFMDDSVLTEMAMDLRERSIAWVIGTSLGFELVLLAIATIIFTRRDF